MNKARKVAIIKHRRLRAKLEAKRKMEGVAARPAAGVRKKV
ncbi:hypothetical protein ACFLVW_03760 [Chloroflexota bacterium]